MFWIFVAFLILLCVAATSFGFVCAFSPEGQGAVLALVSFGFAVADSVITIILVAIHLMGS